MSHDWTIVTDCLPVMSGTFSLEDEHGRRLRSLVPGLEAPQPGGVAHPARVTPHGAETGTKQLRAERILVPQIPDVVAGLLEDDPEQVHGVVQLVAAARVCSMCHCVSADRSMYNAARRAMSGVPRRMRPWPQDPERLFEEAPVGPHGDVFDDVVGVDVLGGAVGERPSRRGP